MDAAVTPARRPYRRVLLKLSGEAFGLGEAAPNFRSRRSFISYRQRLPRSYAAASKSAIVVGGGNICPRYQISVGASGSMRVTGHTMGMLGTVINGLASWMPWNGSGFKPARPVLDRDAPGRRALHPAPRAPPPREGPRRDLRGAPASRTSRPTPPPHCAPSRWSRCAAHGEGGGPASTTRIRASIPTRSVTSTRTTMDTSTGASQVMDPPRPRCARTTTWTSSSSTLAPSATSRARWSGRSDRDAGGWGAR